jgi:hypothetical protein
MEKRKRAPGGGRKPGPLGKLGEVISLRLPSKLKTNLQRAAKESGRSLSGEAIWRMNASFAGHQPLKQVYWTIYKLDAWLAEVKRELGLPKSKGRK